MLFLGTRPVVLCTGSNPRNIPKVLNNFWLGFKASIQTNTTQLYGINATILNYSKTCVKQILQKDKTKVLTTSSSLMKVESIAECCNTFDMH